MADNEEIRNQTAADADNERKARLESETGESDPDIARFKAQAAENEDRARRQLEADIERLKSEEATKAELRNQQIDGTRVNEVPEREVGTDLNQPVPVAVDALIEEKLGEKDEEFFTDEEESAKSNPEV